MCKFIISAHPRRDLKQLEATLKAANLKVADEAYIVEHFAADWAEYAQGYGCLLNNFDKFIPKIEPVHVGNHCSRRKKLVPWMKII